MASWTIRIGLIVPDVNVVVEPELNMIRPRYVSFHTARATYDFASADPLGELVNQIPIAVKQLMKARVHVIGFACTGASFYQGYGSDLEICRQIRNISGVEATTASTAIINCLKRLNLSSVALAAPYDEWVIEKEISFLQANGFEVASSSGLGVRDGGAICSFNLDDAWRVALEADSEKAESVLISCTNFETFQVITQLQHELRKPILSSNLALAWELLVLTDKSRDWHYADMLSLLKCEGGEYFSH